MEDKQAEADLLSMVDQIMADEYAKAKEEDPAALALMKIFRITQRQAVASIERAQRNVAALMIGAGHATEEQTLTVGEVGAWANMHLSYEQKLCITAHSVGAQTQLDWLYGLDPATGERIEPDYQI